MFGLVPAALVGMHITSLIESACEAEALCASDDLDNPASNLAAFLFDTYERGRDKFSLFTPKRGRVLGLWIEQLVAESLGKNGYGILPNIEVDSLVLREDPKDRTVITYNTKPIYGMIVRTLIMLSSFLTLRFPKCTLRFST